MTGGLASSYKKRQQHESICNKNLDQFNQTQIGFGNYTNAFGDLQNYGVITDPGILETKFLKANQIHTLRLIIQQNGQTHQGTQRDSHQRCDDNVRVIMMDLAMYQALKSFQGQNVTFKILWD